MPSIIEDLSKMHMLRNVNERHIRQLLQQCSTRIYRPGETVCKQGSQAQEALILVRGQLEVLVPNNYCHRHVGEIYPGEIFGEQSIFSADGTRNATVKAINQSLCLIIDKKTMKNMSNNPMLIALEKQLLVTLARRLRNTNLAIQKTWKEEKKMVQAEQRKRVATEQAHNKESFWFWIRNITDRKFRYHLL